MIIRLLAVIIASCLLNAKGTADSPIAFGTRGILIDASSEGSRLHVFTWKPRVFSAAQSHITIPEADEMWTGRMTPGIDSMTPNLIPGYLQPLIDFAKTSLSGYEDEFKNYPIYFKATGGMRELETNSRENLLRAIRAFLSDKTQCPFYFRSDFAHVISGDEQARFSWTAINFLMGTLLPDSQGLGSVSNLNVTYGTLDLGGTSTQIAFHLPSQDSMEGLYNLQIGSQKHWNVYTKSFLQFGIVSARLRYIHDIAARAVAERLLIARRDHLTHGTGPGMTHSPTVRATMHNTHFSSSSGQNSTISATDPCFHSGYIETIQDSSGLYSVDISGPPLPQQDQLTQCMTRVRDLMKLGSNKHFKDFPGIPAVLQNNFIGQSTYIYPWKFFQLPPTASLEQFREKAENICALNFGDVLFYFESNNLGLDPDKLNIYLPYYCFLSSYILVLLHDGYRFPMNTTLTVLDQVNGHKVGWALGAILYEINELPWTLQLSTIESYPWGFVLVGSLLGFILGATAAVCIYRDFVERRRVDAHHPSATSSDDGYDEKILRTTTVELIGGGGGGVGKSGNISGAGVVGGVSGGIGINIGGGRSGSSKGGGSGGAVRRPSLTFSPPGSPPLQNRKRNGAHTAAGGIASHGVPFISPYASPAKPAIPSTQRSDSVFQSVFRNGTTALNRFEPIPYK